MSSSAVANGDTEQELIEDLMTANKVWAFLKEQHMKQEKAESRFMADQVTEWIHLTMQLAKGSVSTTLVVMTNTGIKQKITTCTNCGKRGHHMESCISTGGGMAGKMITEAQATMGKKKQKVDPLQANIATSAAPPAPPASANVCVSQGHTWVVNGSQAFLVNLPMQSMPPTSLALAPMVNQNANLYGNFAGFTSNSSDEAYAIPASTSHHAWIAIAGPLTTSLDWALQSHQVAANAMMASIIEHMSCHQEMDLHKAPWWLDSGASTHISPERSDFFELYPMSHSSPKLLQARDRGNRVKRGKDRR
ncbi:hypothetical protein BDN71DRAFT_1429967 [Pleurotus eryngii]|uniref:CCHC-type domain-containing protein n=1 Tax=Pleurotus eryngii TaxID=5323 RepID=A0A9P6D9V3_PLEER|nr:hypothetical protein BDN71DRAFT_1429967 [Pleurotus eryngii]